MFSILPKAMSIVIVALGCALAASYVKNRMVEHELEGANKHITDLQETVAHREAEISICKSDSKNLQAEIDRQNHQVLILKNSADRADRQAEAAMVKASANRHAIKVPSDIKAGRVNSEIESKLRETGALPMRANP